MYTRQIKIAKDLGLPEMWKIQADAKDVIIAVVDTGIDLKHPDLTANLLRNDKEIPGNFIDDDGNGYIDDRDGWNSITDYGDPQDDEGHGTMVAGTIAARGKHCRGIIGVVRKTKLLPVKFLNSSGWGYYSDAVQALEYCIVRKLQTGLDMVINCSWTGEIPWPELEAVNKRATDMGIVVVASAGNNYGGGPRYPAAYPNVLSVAALDLPILATLMPSASMLRPKELKC
jgi:subtilisin family serine protease